MDPATRYEIQIYAPVSGEIFVSSVSDKTTGASIFLSKRQDCTPFIRPRASLYAATRKKLILRRKMTKKNLSKKQNNKWIKRIFSFKINPLKLCHKKSKYKVEKNDQS